MDDEGAGRRRGRLSTAASIVRRGAERAAERVRPEISDHRRVALDAATNAVLGTAANLAIAAFSGLLGGRIHPSAPQVIYSILAVGTGVYIADKNRAVGAMLASGGMVIGSQIVLRTVVAKVTGRSAAEVPADALSVANRVGQSVSGSPAPTLPAATAAPSPSPSASSVA